MTITEQSMMICRRDCEGRETAIELSYRGDKNAVIKYSEHGHPENDCTIRIPVHVLNMFLGLINE